MSTTQRRTIEEGDRYVDTENGRVNQITHVGDDEVTVNRGRYSRTMAHSRDTAEEAIADPDSPFVHEDDLNLSTTDIKGIGEATALELYAATGMTEPSEVAEAYIAGDATGVTVALRREDYLQEWIHENPDVAVSPSAHETGAFDELDDDQAVIATRVMIFLREFDADWSTKCSMDDDGVPIVGTHDSQRVDGDKVTADQVLWFDGGTGEFGVGGGTFGGRILDPSKVIALAWGDGACLPDEEEMSPTRNVDSIEEDGPRYLIEDEQQSAYYSAEYVDRAASVLGVEDVVEHTYFPDMVEDHGVPCWIVDPETDVRIAIAPRIESP